VAVTVELDATIDVVDEMAQAIIGVIRAIGRVEKPPNISGMMSSRP
jgi:hypothetical protein